MSRPPLWRPDIGELSRVGLPRELRESTGTCHLPARQSLRPKRGIGAFADDRDFGKFSRARRPDPMKAGFHEESMHVRAPIRKLDLFATTFRVLVPYLSNAGQIEHDLLEGNRKDRSGFNRCFRVDTIVRRLVSPVTAGEKSINAVCQRTGRGSIMSSFGIPAPGLNFRRKPSGNDPGSGGTMDAAGRPADYVRPRENGNRT